MTSIPQFEKLFEHELEAGGDSTKALLLGVELINARMKLEGLEKEASKLLDERESLQESIWLMKSKFKELEISQKDLDFVKKQREWNIEAFNSLKSQIQSLKGIEE